MIKIEIKNYDEETPELRKEFKRLGLQPFDSLHFQFKQIPEGVYHVETNHIFGNQYNTTEGYRIFEKCTSLVGSKMRKDKGYYISKGIKEIRAYQDKVKVCGYCGLQYYETDQTVCLACLGSEYLKESELHLLKLLPVRDSFNGDRKLTSKEQTTLIDKYRVAQGLGKAKREETARSKNRQRVAKLIPEAKEKSKELLEKAETKTEAYTWLLDNGVNILDNVIYYTHTKRFCFGWSKPLTDSEKSGLLDVLVEFPFDYDIK